MDAIIDLDNVDLQENIENIRSIQNNENRNNKIDIYNDGKLSLSDPFLIASCSNIKADQVNNKEEGNVEERVHSFIEHRSSTSSSSFQHLSKRLLVNDMSIDHVSSDSDDDYFDENDDVSEFRQLTQPHRFRHCIIQPKKILSSSNNKQPYNNRLSSANMLAISNATKTASPSKNLNQNYVKNDSQFFGLDYVAGDDVQGQQSTSSSSSSVIFSGIASSSLSPLSWSAERNTNIATITLDGESLNNSSNSTSDSPLYSTILSSNESTNQSGQFLVSNHHHQICIGSSCISVHSAASQASNDSSLLDYPVNTPICKFCHQRGKSNNPLISPCYCKGTIRYMHARCLMKWLDKLKRRNSRSQPLSCEICNYEYRWRKQFKAPIEWTLPPCMGNDRHWHTIFVICVIFMVISMINLVIFGDDEHTHHHYHSQQLNRSVVINSYNGNKSSSAFINEKSINADTLNSSFTFQHHSTLLPSGLDLFQQINNQSDESDAMILFPAAAGFSSMNASTLTTLLQNISSDLNPVIKLNKSLKKKLHLLTEKNLMSKIFDRQNNDSINNGSNNSNDMINNNNNNPKEYNPFLVSQSDPWRRRKSYPAKPHEVILVISGCLFFISFFLGTFAQIKSEISFYNMMMKFIHWNQQWIIEEYNPEIKSSSHSINKMNDSISNTQITPSQSAVFMNDSTTVMQQPIIDKPVIIDI